MIFFLELKEKNMMGSKFLKEAISKKAFLSDHK